MGGHPLEARWPGCCKYSSNFTKLVGCVKNIVGRLS